MANVSNEQLHQELTELKGLVANLEQGISRLLPPVQELEINSLARSVSSGKVEDLAAWNKRKKANRKKS